jgi:Undecaprenyl-phosphate glucose phosphotransferase
MAVKESSMPDVDQASPAAQSSAMPTGSAVVTEVVGGVKLSTVIIRLMVVKFVVVAISAYVGSVVYIQFVLSGGPPTGEYIPAALLIATLVVSISISFKHFEAIQTQPLHKFMWNGLGSVALAFAFFLSALFLFKWAGDYSRGTFVFQFIAVAGAVLSVRAVTHRRLQSAIAAGRVQARRAILIGKPANCTRVCEWLKKTGVDVVHSTAIPKYGDDSGPEHYDHDIRKMMATFRALQPDDIVLVSSTEELATIQRLISYLSELPASLHLVPIDAASLLASSSRGELGTLVTIQVLHPPLSIFDQVAKRAFDIAVAAIALIMLAPLFLIVAIAIKLDSRGPVFFRQKRHGYNNETITVIKFRSMITVDDGRNFKQAVKRDPRVTRVGRILRSTNIDELPQLLNVLTGEMSIVGPRPHAIAHNRLFEDKIVPFARRHAIKPGITGWAQVNGYRGETDTLEKMQKRLEYDLYYIDHWSFMLDIKIILMTLFSKKAYAHAL